MRGQGRRRVRRGLHVDHPPRAGRRHRPDRAVELPADDGDLEDRPGAGHRQHDRPQAGRRRRRSRRCKLAEIAAEFLPKGVLNVIRGGDDAGRGARRRTTTSTWSRSPARSRPASGSPRAAAETLKRVHLELGGKAPVVVFDDVDMETALETIAGTGYYNAGQDCTAATRVLAGKRVYDDVVSGLAEQAKGYVLGDTMSRRHDARAAQLRRASASASRASSSASPTTPRSSPAATSPTCPASSSSRPSSRTSSRTTR